MFILICWSTQEEVEESFKYDADGIGIYKTEHIFESKEVKSLFGSFRLSSSVSEREDFLAKILPYHVEDILKVFRLCGDRLLTVQLLSGSVSESIPVEKYSRCSADVDEVLISTFKSSTPEGSHLMSTFADVARMQAKAIFGKTIALICLFSYLIFLD